MTRRCCELSCDVFLGLRFTVVEGFDVGVAETRFVDTVLKIDRHCYCLLKASREICIKFGVSSDLSYGRYFSVSLF